MNSLIFFKQLIINLNKNYKNKIRNKMRKKKDKNIINNNLKAITTLIGDIIMNLIIGNGLIWLYLPETINLNLDIKINQNMQQINNNFTSNKSRKLIITLILTFSNITKLYFTIFTKYSNIRIYIIFSLLPIIISHSLLYMFQIKFTTIIAFIIYGVGIGFPYHQLITNTNLHFINNKFKVLLINKICYHISPLIYLIFFKKYGNIISPVGSEIIIFYLICAIICALISYDYLRECRNEKYESNEQSLLIKNELEFSIADMTGNAERGSEQSENSMNLEKKNKIFMNENENINKVFISKKQSFISAFKDKNIYLIILFLFSANFLTYEKIYAIKSENIFFFLLIIFISNVIIFIIMAKTQLPPLILKLIPLFIHTLIIIYHTFNSKKETFSNKLELFLVSLSFTIQINFILPIARKIYGEKYAVFFSSLILILSSTSAWIFLFIDKIRNSLRILIAVFMILLLLFISMNAFNFNDNKKRNKFGIELQSKDDDEDKNKEKENSIEDVCDIADVKSDVEN